jgi:hypothetical protein
MVRVGVSRAIAKINADVAIHCPASVSEDLADKAQHYAQCANKGANNKKAVCT